LVPISRDPEKNGLRPGNWPKRSAEEQRKVESPRPRATALRAVANRFERARTERDPTIAAEYLSVAKQKLAGSRQGAAWIRAVGRMGGGGGAVAMLVPKEGGPVFEGSSCGDAASVLDVPVIEYAEFGRVDGFRLGKPYGVAGARALGGVNFDHGGALHLEPAIRIRRGLRPSASADVIKGGVTRP
jgi:hypothetical protein